MGNSTVLSRQPGSDRRRLLVVDDDPQFLSLTQRILQTRFEVETCRHPEAALASLERETFDALLVDLYFDEVETELDGFALIERALALVPDLPVIVLSRTQDARDVTRALNLGAFHFVTKHFERDELSNLIERAAQSAFYERQYEIQRKREADEVGGIIYKSDAMRRAIHELQRYAVSDSPILITGESGTGKDLMAQLVHVHSGRKGSFHALNIAALPESLFERELFGHDRGAFTDAHESKRGLLEQADGGTLFIDEIGTLSKERQAALLRVIEDGVVRRLGSESQRKVDVRFVFATNDDLASLRERGAFRDDLWYRISQLHVHLPSLRERDQDALYIADAVLASNGHKNKRLDTSARELLLRYRWPGNVRELKAMLERACLFDDDGVIDRGDLIQSGLLRLIEAVDDGTTGGPRDGDRWELPLISELLPYEEGKHRVERELKRRCLEYGLAVGKGNITRATDVLGVSRQTLYQWMRELGYSSQEPAHE